MLEYRIASVALTLSVVEVKPKHKKGVNLFL